MAGLGRRTFAPGEVLTASNVMNYLQDQAVMNFADGGARGSAIGTAVSEGMVSYLADSDAIEVFDGSDWRKVAATTNSILQIVTASTSTAVSSTSTTLFDSGLTATITPTSASSKILVMVTQQTRVSFAGSTGFLSRFRIALDRSGTLIWDSAVNRYSEFTMTAATNPSRTDILNLSFIDSPGTTSAITYKTQGRNDATTGTIQFNAILGAAGTAHITLMEISA
jgi:hypothetical protein